MSKSALLPTYARSELVFERGQGAYLFTASGDRFLDFASGVAVTALGHAHPHLVNALAEQSKKLWHVSNLHRIPGQERLARRLCQETFADYVFFANSGAEAVEGAMKVARRYHFAQGAPERYRFVTFEGAFHGRTLATISAGGQAKHLEGFGPPVDGFDHVAAGDVGAVEAAIGDTTAGIIIEPIMGEGGMREVSWPFLRDLRALCDEKGILLVLDEVQSGMGRTGRLFAHEWAGITPDVMAISQRPRRRLSRRRRARHGRGWQRDDARKPRLDLRRQPARHGRRQRRARRGSRARLPRSCRGDGACGSSSVSPG